MAIPPPIVKPRKSNPEDIFTKAALANMQNFLPNRKGKDILSQAQLEKQSRNFAEQANPQFTPYYDDISNIRIKDIMLTLAKHGGSIEIKGFGTFYMRDTAGKWCYNRGPMPMSGERGMYYRPPRRQVMFRPNKLLKDMTNLDIKTQETATPNPDFWVEEKHFLV